MTRAWNEIEAGLLGPTYQPAATMLLYRSDGDWHDRPMEAVIARVRELMPSSLHNARNHGLHGPVVPIAVAA
eukprot:1537615-Lingulodinium_polyedra.AAC.1